MFFLWAVFFLPKKQHVSSRPRLNLCSDCVNFHPSLLPKHRGCWWANLRGFRCWHATVGDVVGWLVGWLDVPGGVDKWLGSMVYLSNISQCREGNLESLLGCPATEVGDWWVNGVISPTYKWHLLGWNHPFSVGNPYRPLFTTVSDWRVDPRNTQSCDWDGFEIDSLESTCYAPLIPLQVVLEWVLGTSTPNLTGYLEP